MSMFTRIVGIAILTLGLLPVPASAQGSSYPDGWVIWNSDREDSRMESYIARADGSEVRRLTHDGSYFPSWAPDGRWISYMDASTTLTYVMRPDGSENRLLAVGGSVQWLHDNSGLLISDGTGFHVYDPETGEETLLFTPADYPQFAGTTFQVNAITHDNRYALLGSHLYINGYTGANGSFTSEYSALVLDLLHKDKIYFLGSGCWPFTPPMGDLIFHICATSQTHPDIYRMHLADLDTRASYAPEVAHEDADWGHEYNPRVSNDNRWLAYMASAGCHASAGCDYDIFLHALGSDPSQRLRVTQSPGFDGYPQLYVGPAWQPSVEPRLLVTPNRVTFHASVDALPAARLLKLKNSGGGTLPAATVALDPVVPWLDVTLGSSGIMVELRGATGITRGTHCTNLTIATPGALGSPVTVPVTLIADESFPIAEAGIAWEAGVPLDGGLAEAGVSVDVAASSDVPMSTDPALSLDAGLLDCQRLEGGAPSGDAPADGGAVVGKTSGGGCGCNLGGAPIGTGPTALVLAGLVWLWRRRRPRA
jgi:MYXO-CTERM domain-containing protein